MGDWDYWGQCATSRTLGMSWRMPQPTATVEDPTNGTVVKQVNGEVIDELVFTICNPSEVQAFDCMYRSVQNGAVAWS